MRSAMTAVVLLALAVHAGAQANDALLPSDAIIAVTAAPTGKLATEPGLQRQAEADKAAQSDRVAEPSGLNSGETATSLAGSLMDTTSGPTSDAAQAASDHDLRGDASWYGPRFHGRRTASGERYNKHALTAAHPTLPFGTVVQVRSLSSGREVQVRINDRGPFSRDRMIDLSQSAARLLGMLGAGVHEVQLLIVGQPKQ